jgi:hypothetical protein
MRKLNRKGFTTLELALMILIAGIIGGVGYYVWNAKQNSNDIAAEVTNASSPAQSSKVGTAKRQTLTLNNGKISFSIPYGWSHVSTTDNCTKSDNPTVCTEAVEVAPGDAAKAIGNNTFGVSVSYFVVTDGKSAKDWFFTDLCDCLVSPDWSVSATKINDYDAVHAVQADASYTDENFVLRKGDLAIVVYSRIKDNGTLSGASNGDTSYDKSNYVPQITQIAHSVSIKE